MGRPSSPVTSPRMVTIFLCVSISRELMSISTSERLSLTWLEIQEKCVLEDTTCQGDLLDSCLFMDKADFSCNQLRQRQMEEIGISALDKFFLFLISIQVFHHIIKNHCK